MTELRSRIIFWIKNNKIFFIIALLSLIPFITTWLRGRLLYDFDMTFITAPIEDMFARYERSWQIPMWAPELQFGFPLVAISHLGFFYPLHLILRFFFPGVITLNISLALHILLACLGTYLFLKQEKFSKCASAFGTLIFVGTGFFVGRLYLTNVILPFAWIPINLWFLGRWLQKKTYRSLLALGVGVALQVLLGQPQAALIGAIALSLYAIAHLLTDFKRTFVRVPPIILPAIISVLLCLTQLQPTLSIVRFSDRVDAMLPKELYEFSLPFSHLVSWIFPHAFGYHEKYIGAKNETELSSWLGITVLTILALGIFSAWKKRKRALITFILFIGISLLFVTGENSPLYKYLVEHHWMDSLAIPARWLVLMAISFSVLAAQGWEELSNFSPSKRKIIVISSIPLFFVIAFLSYKNIAPEIRMTVKNNLLNDPLRTSIPIIAAILTSILLIKFPQKKKYLYGLVVLELFVPNITRNVTVPFNQPFIKSQAEEFLKEYESIDISKDGGRLFTQRDLQINLPTKPTLKPLKRLDKSFVLKQTFTSQSDTINGIYIDFRWGNLSKTEGKAFLLVKDAETNEIKKVEADLEKTKDNTPTKFVFDKPFKNSSGHKLFVEISNNYSKEKPGPYVFYVKYPSQLNEDYLIGGNFEICDSNTCKTLDANSGNIDLNISPVYKPLDRIRLAQEILSPHIAASKNYPSTQWLGALQLKEVKRYLYEVGDQNENADGHNPYLEDRREMFNRLGISYFLGSHSAGQNIGVLKEISLIKEWLTETQTVRLYKNLEAHPTVEFVTNIRSVPSPDDARAAMLSAKSANDPVPSEDDTLTQGKEFTSGEVTVKKQKPTEIVLETENSGEGFLLLRQTFFPGWKAFIDGKETRIFASDWIFQGIIVPKGNHQIVFSYENKTASVSIKISFVTWIIVVLFFIFDLSKKPKRNRGSTN